jgi:hypothetical protein
MDERLRRQARNEALLREVNEQISALDRASGGGEDETFGFHCECGRASGCEERVWMTLAEYDVVREQDDRFALAPGHETDGLEQLVADDPRGRSSA